ncbi:unnamed protein product, partial [marine sediment metagenome]
QNGLLFSGDMKAIKVIIKKGGMPLALLKPLLQGG